MKRVQSILLMTTLLTLVACQDDDPVATPTPQENGTEEVENIPNTIAPDSAENNVEAAEIYPSTLNAAPPSEAEQNGSIPVTPERSPAGSKLQRAD